jgi:hypothetical protein
VAAEPRTRERRGDAGCRCPSPTHSSRTLGGFVSLSITRTHAHVALRRSERSVHFLKRKILSLSPGKGLHHQRSSSLSKDPLKKFGVFFRRREALRRLSHRNASRRGGVSAHRPLIDVQELHRCRGAARVQRAHVARQRPAPPRVALTHLAQPRGHLRTEDGSDAAQGGAALRGPTEP